MRQRQLTSETHLFSSRSLDALMTANEDDERDGLDIQSLSVVEAEFFYNKTDEGKSAADIAAAKRTINLDAFHIIKVIGKGEETLPHPVTMYPAFCRTR